MIDRFAKIVNGKTLHLRCSKNVSDFISPFGWVYMGQSIEVLKNEYIYIYIYIYISSTYIHVLKENPQSPGTASVGSQSTRICSKNWEWTTMILVEALA